MKALYLTLFRQLKVNGILGDSVNIDQVKSFHAVGRTEQVSPDNQYEFKWSAPVRKRVYRVERHIKLNEEYVRWVYLNPIYTY